jgi:hypothetical protein
MVPGWDESLEEYCTSPEEIEELKGLVSLLSQMEQIQASPSYQQELKMRLLEREKADLALKERKAFSLSNFKNWRASSWIRPLFATAAAFLLVISLTVFYGDARSGQQGSLHTAREDFVRKTLPLNEISAEDHSGKGMEESNEGTVEIGENVDGDKINAVEPPPEQSPGAEVNQDLPQHEHNTSPVQEEIGTPPEQKKETPLPVQSQDNPAEEGTIKEEPQFEIWGKKLQAQLAASVKLPDYYYNVVAGEKDFGLAEAKYDWRPGGKIVIMVNGNDEAGLEADVSKKLSGKGFQVDGAYLKVNSIQETQKGNFAEVFFKSQKCSADDPLLVVYYEEGKDIVSFYCEEKGGTGYYLLLTPAQAFERSKEAKVYASSELLRFSFQEVNLTYYDFPQGDGRQEKLVKLPAYCFTGMETGPGGKEFKLYLPAVG